MEVSLEVQESLNHRDNKWQEGQRDGKQTLRGTYSKLVCSVQFSLSVMSTSLQPHGLQHARPPCSSPTPRVYSNLCPLSQWCHPAFSSSIIPFSSCLQSSPASGSFQMSQLFVSGVKVLEFQFQHQSFQWIFRADFLYNGLLGFPCSPRDSQESSPTSGPWLLSFL